MLLDTVSVVAMLLDTVSVWLLCCWILCLCGCYVAGYCVCVSCVAVGVSSDEGIHLELDDYLMGILTMCSELVHTHIHTYIHTYIHTHILYSSKFSR